MFQPQNVICPRCGTQHQIITEDIPSGNIYMCSIPFASGHRLCVQLECPDCHNRFNLCFIEKSKAANHDTLFECTEQSNVGLQMWKRIEGCSLKIPSYFPNMGNRTAFEKSLDEMALAMVDKIHPWKEQPKPAKTLADYLGEVDDYTKQITWKKFKKRQLIVAFCAHDGGENYYHGFNGLFNTVKVKNQVLEQDFVSKLGGHEEDLPKHYCNNKIGHCAEVHAANSCLNHEPAPNTDDLRFSIAYQCRTAHPRSYCLNCITLFHGAKNG